MAVRSVKRGDPSHRDFAVNEYLFYLLAQAMDQYELGIEAVLKPLGFNKARWRVLMSLREQDGASISEISAMTSLRRSTTSRVVEQLEAEALVRRAANGADNRVTEVFLKPAGRDALRKIVTVIGRQYRRSVEGLPATELRIVKRALRTVVDNLKRSPIG